MTSEQEERLYRRVWYLRLRLSREQRQGNKGMHRPRKLVVRMGMTYEEATTLRQHWERTHDFYEPGRLGMNMVLGYSEFSR